MLRNNNLIPKKQARKSGNVTLNIRNSFERKSCCKLTH